MKPTESRSHTGHHSQRVQYDSETEKKVATALWKPVGSFCLIAALALVAAMTSEKVGPSLLSFIGQNPFAITLFGIPALCGGLVALSLIGGAYARAAQDASHCGTLGFRPSSMMSPEVLLVFESVLSFLLVSFWFR